MKIATILFRTYLLRLTSVIFALGLLCLVCPLAPALAQLNIETSGTDTIKAFWTPTALNIETSLSSRISVENGFGFGFVFSPDGSTIAVSMRGNRIDLWNVRSGQRVATLQADIDEGEDPQHYLPKSLEFSPDGQTLAALANNNNARSSRRLHLWDVRTGRHIAKTTIEGFWDLSFSPDGRTIVTGNNSWRQRSAVTDTLYFWDARTLRHIDTVEHKVWEAHYVKFSPDGQIIVTVGTQEGNVSFWDARTRQFLGSLGQKLQNLKGIAFSRDGRTLVASHSNENSFDFYFWDVSTRRHITTLQMRSGNFALSPVGEILATPVGQESVDFWNVSTHQRITTTLTSPEFSFAFAFNSYLTFSPGGETLAAVVREPSGGRAVYFWDVTIGVQEQIVENGVQEQTVENWEYGDSFIDHTSLVRALAFSPDSQILASGGKDTIIHLRHPTTGNLLRSLRGHTRTVTSVAFSPTGQRLASSSADGTIRLWNPQTGGLLRTIPNAHSSGVQSVAFSADGRLLASGGRDNTVGLWDPQTGRLVSRLSGHTDWVLGVAFSREGLLASASRDRSIRLWDTNGQFLRSLRGHTDYVTSVAFGSTGELVSGSRDLTVRSWNPQTGRVVHVFRGHTDFVNSVSVSVSGGTVASAGADLSVGLWDLGTGASLGVRAAQDTVRVVAFAPDDQWLAAGDESGVVSLWQQRSAPSFCFTPDPAPFVTPSPSVIPPGASLALVVVPVVWTQAHTLYSEKPTEGIVLTVGFFGGDSYRRGLVEKYAPKWSQHSGIHFRFLDESGPADIVVGFKEGNHPSHSNVGIGSISSARKGIPTMNLNFANYSTEEGLRGVILHEFGHALGLSHEHKSPAAGINRSAMMRELGPRFRERFTKEGYTGEELEKKIKEHIEINYSILSSDVTQTNFSTFDPHSIMLYSGLPVIGGGMTKYNTDLSETDQRYIGYTYPKPDQRPASMKVTGTLFSEEYRNGNFQEIQQELPRIPLKVDTGDSIQFSVEVLSSYGARLPAGVVEFSVEEEPYADVSFDGSTLARTGVEGKAATAKARFSGVDGYVTLHIEVLNSNLKKSFRIFIKGQIQQGYKQEYEFTKKASRDLFGGEVDWVHSITIPSEKDSKIMIEDVEVNGGLGDYGCGFIFGGCGSAGVYKDKTTWEGDTVTFHGWYENGAKIWADAHVHGWIKYYVLGSDPMTGSGIAVVTGGKLAPSKFADANNFAMDINRDGQVDAADLVLVSNYIGQTGSVDPRVDVNGDGIVTIADLVLVAQYLGQSSYSSAPAAVIVPAGLQYSTVAGWIDHARAEDDGSLIFRQGIANLEFLLTLIVPEKTTLLPNYPNPFNPETWIPYHLAEPADVTLTIYAIDGTVVRRLALGHQAAGYYQRKSRAAYWDGRNELGERVASGVYFYTFTAGKFSATGKMLVRK